jgi:hypothetical protein
MAETVRRGAARGFVPALFVQLGLFVGDTTKFIVALTGLAFIVQNNVANYPSLITSACSSSPGMPFRTRVTEKNSIALHPILTAEILQMALSFPWAIP